MGSTSEIEGEDVRIFSHIGDPAPSPDHSVFWKHWFERLIEQSPALTRRVVADPSDPSATHEFVSHGGVKIGCRLVLPGNGLAVRASLVCVHGYHTPGPLADDEHRWRRVADRGVAVLLIRLRGYPGSRAQCGDLTTPGEHGCGWIGRGLLGSSHEDWIVPDAIADVCNACRVMRNALLHRDTDTDFNVDGSIDHPGVYLSGSSLGGGLAAISAAQLIGRLSGESIIDRLALGVPSLGDWRWRLAHGRGGTGNALAQLLKANADRQDQLMDRLRLCDAVVHGRKVRVATLGLLARRDEVVPPECSAAVFNAIDADPGRKWRFVVPRSHCDLRGDNARRHALFEQARADFFDPACVPIESMTRWEPLLHNGLEPPGGRADD